MTEPSKVIHVRNVGHEISENDLLQLFQPFGVITKLVMLRAKNQALLQMQDIPSAVNALQFYSHAQPSIRGRNVYIQFSSHQELTTMEQTGQARADEPNRILLVTIHHVLYPITVQVLHQVFSPHGFVEKIVTFQKTAGFQALIQYHSQQNAVAARNALQGRNIYDGCCQLDIQFSNLDELQVNYNNDRSRDYTNSSLPSEQSGRSSHTGYGDVGVMHPSAAGALPAYPQVTNNAAAFGGTLPAGITGTNDRCTILVSNLNAELIDEDKLFNLFSIYGNIVRIKILRNKPDHALIQMGDGLQAELAVHFLKGAKLFGKRMEVNFSKFTNITTGADTREYATSNLNRFNRNAAKNYRYCCSPTKMIHISTLPQDVIEAEITAHLEEKHLTIVNSKLFEMNGKKLRNLTLMIIISFLVWSCAFFEATNANARQGKHWSSRHRKGSGSSDSISKKKPKYNHHRGNAGGKGKSKPLPPPPATTPPPPSPVSPPRTDKGPSILFNVLDFGAKGDGKTDDTKAFEAAWANACKKEASTLMVPAKYVFLVGPISFSGPYCQHNIVFQLDGKIVAPTNAKVWGSTGILQWLEFTKLVGITVTGGGVIDGNGAVWWQDVPFQDPLDNESEFFVPLNGTILRSRPPMPERDYLGIKMPSIRPTALRFYGSYNVSVTGITIQNSPQCHLKFDNCIGVAVHNFTVSSPGDSPNTDGIHLQNSKDVHIHSSYLGCGDDCVSVQTGCTNVYIHDVNCGPGHGISIGGLGKDNTKACVSNITVRNIFMQNTMNGVRIKTWQGGLGSVQGVLFSNIQVSEVQIPVIIDQFYCDKEKCKNQTSAVSLTGIHFEQIRGTYTVKPVHLACSDTRPCTQVTLSGIQLKPVQKQYHMYDPYCWKTYGELYSPAIPPVQCLQGGKPSSSTQGEDDSC